MGNSPHLLLGAAVGFVHDSDWYEQLETVDDVLVVEEDLVDSLADEKGRLGSAEGVDEIETVGEVNQVETDI